MAAALSSVASSNPSPCTSSRSLAPSLSVPQPSRSRSTTPVPASPTREAPRASIGRCARLRRARRSASRARLAVRCCCLHVGEGGLGRACLRPDRAHPRATSTMSSRRLLTWHPKVKALAVVGWSNIEVASADNEVRLIHDYRANRSRNETTEQHRSCHRSGARATKMSVVARSSSPRWNVGCQDGRMR